MTTVWTLPSSSARPKAETGHYILTRRKRGGGIGSIGTVRRGRLLVGYERGGTPPKRERPGLRASFIRNAPSNTRSGKTVYIRKEFHERITRIVQVIGKNELSLYSYLDNVLEQHFATYQEEISELYKKRNSDIFSYEPNIYNPLKQSIMSDKAIILSVILAAVLCVAVPFIFRVCRYRRRMKTLIVPDGPSGEVAVGTVPTPEAEYLARYICLLRLPFAGNKHVKIRPSYHERIREITRVIGRGDVTITAYVDKVLKAHLDDNRETIERLFEEREAVASRQPKAEER